MTGQPYHNYPPPGQPPRPATKPGTPWWKQPLIIALAAGLIGIGVGSAMTSTDASRPTPTQTVTATATVTADPRPAPTVTETVTAPPAPEPTAAAAPEAQTNSASEATTGGLDAYDATRACGNLAETGLKAEYPNSRIRVHTLIGILARDYRAATDDWFIKVEASVDRNTLNVECQVSGNTGAPSVDSIAWY